MPKHAISVSSTNWLLWVQTHFSKSQLAPNGAQQAMAANRESCWQNFTNPSIREL